MVPTVQEKELGAEAVREILGLEPLHTVTVFAVVTSDFGFTVTVIVYGSPSQFPVLEVGVTMY